METLRQVGKKKLAKAAIAVNSPLENLSENEAEAVKESNFHSPRLICE
jgi:hypothetical protein